MKRKKLYILLLITLMFAAAKYFQSLAVSDDLAEKSIARILGSMTLEEKVGQMALVAEYAIKDRKEDIRHKGIGAVLSGGGGNPVPNTPESWLDMTKSFQREARASRLAIPLFYGVDAVHGHGNLKGAVIFPHNIGLGAAGDPELAKKSAAATAKEMRATGANWNFAPVLSLPLDMRWGRVYEAFSNDLDLVSSLATKYIQGLQAEKVLATPKHFLGEGFEDWRSSENFILDQGIISMGEDDLLRQALEPFRQAVESGAMSIMVSRSSWQGAKISASKRLLTDVLKGDLGFAGFLVSDWGAIDHISPDHYQSAVAAINAGIDMVMIPEDYDRFISNVLKAVADGDISQERIDDAVARILRAKQSIGLFDPGADERPDLDVVGQPAHRQIAREAVRRSLVLLKNDNALPIAKGSSIILAGKGADDIGLQSGGWTVEWQGRQGDITIGTSILEGFRREFPDSQIVFAENGGFNMSWFGQADIGIAVIAEKPYAEGLGDTESLELTAADLAVVEAVRRNSRRTVVVILAGRALMISNLLAKVDAAVMAWLPGSEGDAVAEVFSGRYDFAGKLPLPWPKSMADVRSRDRSGHLFAFGYGLRYPPGSVNE
jgi:beta-glucosidase